jgi:hypothetical protein
LTERKDHLGEIATVLGTSARVIRFPVDIPGARAKNDGKISLRQQQLQGG